MFKPVHRIELYSRFKAFYIDFRTFSFKASRPNEGNYGLTTLLQVAYHTLHLSFKYTIDYYTYN